MTKHKFKNIDFNKVELGLHVGTKKASFQRVTDLGYDLNKICVYEIEIEPTQENTLILPDMHCFDELSVVSCIIDEWEEWEEDIIQADSCRQFLLDRGYKYIGYINQTEDPGSTSYIILEDLDVSHISLINFIMKSI